MRGGEEYSAWLRSSSSAYAPSIAALQAHIEYL